MDISNLLNLMDINSTRELCTQLEPILRLVGWVVLGIKIAVPIILIVIGMMDLAKAIAGKDEKVIKEAQSGLIKKAIAAVLVFLVATLVGVLMSLIGANEYENCTRCINTPWECSATLDN